VITDTHPQQAQTFGARLREARQAAQMSIYDLAAEVALSPSYVSKIETDTYAPPPEQTLDALAQALAPHVTRGELLWRKRFADRWGAVAAPDELVWDNLVPLIINDHAEVQWVDAAVTSVVRALNRLPNLITVSSCSGHADLRASILFRAADGDNDALMASAGVRALATNHDADWNSTAARSVTRRLSGGVAGVSSAAEDDFELEFWGYGDGFAARYAVYRAQIALIEQACARQIGEVNA
jgi:transcriptional regulator with XRE-family HTH domain